MIGRALVGALARGGTRTPLSVLIFHRVLPERHAFDFGDPDAAHFDALLTWVKEWFDVISLADAVAGLRSGKLPARPLAITFDDGYADNCTVALPILRRLGLPATFFVATGFLDGGRMWNDTVIESIRKAPGAHIDLDDLGLGQYPIGTQSDRVAAINALLGRMKYLELSKRREVADGVAQKVGVPRDPNLMLTKVQLRELAAAGMTIGAHTVTHPILARLSDSDALNEMAQSKEQLESLLRQPVKLFAYPNGKPEQDYTASHVSIARKLGFDGAVSTAWGAARDASDLYQIPRFTPWDRTKLRFMMRLVGNLSSRSRDRARDRIARAVVESDVAMG